MDAIRGDSTETSEPESLAVRFGRWSGSIAGVDRVALVVFRTEPGRADSCHDGEKLLEGHLKVEKAALTEDPAVIVEDFIRNHQRQAGLAGDKRKTSRCV